MPDNGIKFLSRGGIKLDDAIEHAIEQRLREPWDRPTGREGRPDHAVRRRRRRLRRAPRRDPVDVARRAQGGPRLRARRRLPRPARRRCATPAPTSSRSAPSPDGLNINDGCGSTHLERPPGRRARARRRPRLRPRRGRRPLPRRGPRRATSSTATSSSRSSPLALRDAGRLVDDTVVATVMSNLGFVQAMQREGDQGRADQGGRPLRPRGDEGAAASSLGGEQSGHVILSDHATTGDGILTALQVLDRIAATGRVAP